MKAAKNYLLILIILISTFSFGLEKFKEGLTHLRDYGRKLELKIKTKITKQSPVQTVLNEYNKWRDDQEKKFDKVFQKRNAEYTVLYNAMMNDLNQLEQKPWVDTTKNNQKIIEKHKQPILKSLKKEWNDKLFRIKSIENQTLTEIMEAERQVALANFFISELRRLGKQNAQELRSLLDINPEELKENSQKRLESETKKRNANLLELKKVSQEIKSTKERYIA